LAKRDNVVEQAPRVLTVVKKSTYAKARADQADAQIKGAEAGVEKAEADLEQARQNLVCKPIATGVLASMYLLAVRRLRGLQPLDCVNDPKPGRGAQPCRRPLGVGRRARRTAGRLLGWQSLLWCRVRW